MITSLPFAGARSAGLPAWHRHVNRVLPDAEIVGFTDAFARRIAAFGKVAFVGIKKLADMATLLENDAFAPRLQACFATACPLETSPFAQLLLNNGLQQPGSIGTNLCTAIGKLRQESVGHERCRRRHGLSPPPGQSARVISALDDNRPGARRAGR
jgi:hypothetical protein